MATEVVSDSHLWNLYEVSAQIVNDLRSDKYDALGEKLTQMIEEQNRIREVIANA